MGKAIQYPTESHRTIDDLFRDLVAAQKDLARKRWAMDSVIEDLKRQWQPSIAADERQIEALEKRIAKVAANKDGVLFPATLGPDGEETRQDRIDLSHGALLRKIVLRAKRIKGMLGKLELLGTKYAMAAIKIAKSVDWDQVDTWSDEQLKKAGTERVQKTEYAWELFDK